MSGETPAETFRAVLIDPATRLIAEVRFAGRPQQFVGDVGLDFFAIAQHADGGFEQGCADDVGLLGGPVYAFRFDNGENPIAGRCLIIGATRSGETCDSRMSLSFIEEHVAWLGKIQPHVEWQATPFGSRAVVTYRSV
jgi:hypothetical protein